MEKYFLEQIIIIMNMMETFHHIHKARSETLEQTTAIIIQKKGNWLNGKHFFAFSLFANESNDFVWSFALQDPSIRKCYYGA